PHWGGMAERLRRYTNKNSNYQVGIGSNDLRISEDGYIWSARNRVVRINANQPELPPALPEWATYVTNPKKALPIIAVIMIPWLLWILFWGLYINFTDARYRKS